MLIDIKYYGHRHYWYQMTTSNGEVHNPNALQRTVVQDTDHGLDFDQRTCIQHKHKVYPACNFL